jgi:hypothetical protein
MGGTMAESNAFILIQSDSAAQPFQCALRMLMPPTLFHLSLSLIDGRPKTVQPLIRFLGGYLAINAVPN